MSLSNLKTSRLAPLIALITAMLSIQSGAAMAKKLFALVGSEGTSALRLAFAAILLGFLWRPWKKLPPLKEFQPILAYGVVLGLMNLFFYLAIERIPLGIAVAIEFTGPLCLSLLSSRHPRDFLWAALAALGIFLLTPTAGLARPLDTLGVIYAFIAALCWALYIVCGQRAVRRHSGSLVTSIGMFVAAVMVFPVGVYDAGPKLFQLSLFPLALAVGFFSSALPYTLEIFALERIPKKEFGILMSLEPAVATLSGLLFLKESLGPVQILAVLLIMLASAGTAWTAPRPAPKVINEG
jgi:inner membrane transporter RhtA